MIFERRDLKDECWEDDGEVRVRPRVVISWASGRRLRERRARAAR